MELTPIGRIRTPFETAEDAPRQGFKTNVEGRIELDPDVATGITGTSPGDRLIVVWFAHDADRSKVLFDRGEPRGVFTTRSQDRPNPVCCTETLVTHLDGRIVHVRGVDMLDGTPLIDLKPPLDASRPNTESRSHRTNDHEFE